MFLKINLLKTLDRVLGKFLSEILRRIISPRKTLSNKVKKILIIRPGGIGDAVLLLPSLTVLKKNYPKSEIHVLAEKRNGGIFQFCTDISKLYLYDDLKHFDLVRLFKNKYDLVIDTEQWHTLSSVIGYITRAEIRVGFNTNKRTKLFSDFVEYSQDDYEARSFLYLIEKVIEKEQVFDPNQKFVDLKENNFGSRGKLEKLKSNTEFIVGLFYGATVNERKWRVSNYAQLANRFIDKNMGIVLVGGRSDLGNLDEFLGNVKDSSKILEFVGKISLEESASIISQTDLFISTDSGLMHLAYGLGVNTLSLFGAGIERKWGPKGKNNYIINKSLFCSPCTKFGYTPKCPYNVRCLSEIGVDEVYDNAIQILGVRDQV